MSHLNPKPATRAQTQETSLRGQVGHRIRELRKRRGWNQRELAAYANLSASRLNKYEMGAHQAPLGALIRIARSFGTLVDVLLPDNLDLPRDPDDVQLLQRLRRLATLPRTEKRLACALLDVVLAVRILVGARPGDPAARQPGERPAGHPG